MSILRARAALIAGFAATAATVAALSLAVNGAANATTPSAALNSVLAVDDVPPPLSVETLNYPNAAEILQDQGILLKRGDGNIVLEQCNSANDIVVKNRISATVEFCFDVRAAPGFLTLELDDAFAIRTRPYAVTATVTANGQKSVINVEADDYKGFGEGVEGERSMVVELRVVG
ncbi:hypothetical protein ACWEP8_33290 [Streptomyces hydrogenans]